MTEAPKRDIYRVEIAGLTRDLPLFEVAPGVRIAVLNILGDVELVQAAAEVLTPLLLARRPETLLTAETKSIPLVHVLAAMMDRSYVVLRKSYKPYMGAAMSAETLSITTGATQTNGDLIADNIIISPSNIGIANGISSTASSTNGTTIRDNQIYCGSWFHWY